MYSTEISLLRSLVALQQQDTDTLIEKMLLIKNVDFQLSPNQRLVTNMRQQPEDEVTDEQLLTAIPNDSVVHFK